MNFHWKRITYQEKQKARNSTREYQSLIVVTKTRCVHVLILENPVEFLETNVVSSVPFHD